MFYLVHLIPIFVNSGERSQTALGIIKIIYKNAYTVDGSNGISSEIDT